MKAPTIRRLSGGAMRALAAAARSPTRHAAAAVMREQLGIKALLRSPSETFAELPVEQRPQRARQAHGRNDAALGVPPAQDFQFGIEALQRAYADGRTTPLAVVEHALGGAEQLAARTPTLGPLLATDAEGARRAAEEAASRIAGGNARPLEGVVTVIKEELDVEGLPTGLGTNFWAKGPATGDATTVARLRAAGAIVLGQTPMTQFGMSPLGGNPHRRMPRNPHNPGHLAGGSSTGSAVAVATGLCPMALGLDGGGSIRVPSSFCGVFGLKPTFGRVPVAGHGSAGGSSVVHAGPIGAGSLELALFLDAVAGADPADACGTGQPAPDPQGFVRALGRGVRGLRIGLPEREWAAADPAIAGPAREALESLTRDGAELVRIELPLADQASPIGFLTIGLECASYIARACADDFKQLEPYLQLFVGQFSAFQAFDYLEAQRLRAALRAQVTDALRRVDAIALPTTNCTAPPVTDGEMESGFLDPQAIAATSRFAYIGNLTGIPAGTAPVGMVDGLPVGLQLMADAWDEATVLQLLAHLQRTGAARVQRPDSHLPLAF